MVQRLWDGRLLCAVRGCLGRFSGHQQGTIAILYALLAIPTLGIVFGGIDYSRALSIQNQFQTAADAAARLAASRLYEGRSTAKSAFRAAFRSNLPDDLKDHPYDLNIASDRSSVSVRVTASVPTTMIAILGVSRLDVAASVTAKAPVPGVFARRKAPLSLQVPGGRPSAPRVRSKLERVIRSSGSTDVRLPSDKKIEQARRQMQQALRQMGQAGRPNASENLPSAAELERHQRQIQRELQRLRF